MKEILVFGLINIETTLKIDKFPLYYNPVNYPFFGVNSTVSGVGYNISKALTILGNKVKLCSLIGHDVNSEIILNEMVKNNISTDNIFKNLEETPQSVIIYDNNGNRQINVDLKNIQEIEYPLKNYEKDIYKYSIAVLCNINFSRKFLKIIKEKNILIATDVHAISDVWDDYNKDFMEYSDILFMSNDNIENNEKEFILKIAKIYNNEIIVMGLGNRGALLYVKKDNFLDIIPAIKIRNIVNTIGAGDSLLSCFIHFFNKTQDPYISLKKAVIFASYKIGEKSASKGFLTEKELDKLYKDLF